MQPNINLATRVYIDTKRLNLLTALAVALLAILLFVNIRSIVSAAAETRRLEGEIGAFEGQFKASSGGVTEKEYQELLNGIRFANNAIAKKTFNWLGLLDRLEVVVSDGIALSAIEPDIKGNALRLSGNALGFGNLRRFLENLEDSKFFTDVYLVSQGDTKVGETQKGITFTISSRVDFGKL